MQVLIVEDEDLAVKKLQKAIQSLDEAMEIAGVTDSIQATEAVRVSQKIRQLSIAPLMGEAIKRITEERSVSSLFD